MDATKKTLGDLIKTREPEDPVSAAAGHFQNRIYDGTSEQQETVRKAIDRMDQTQIGRNILENCPPDISIVLDTNMTRRKTPADGQIHLPADAKIDEMMNRLQHDMVRAAQPNDLGLEIVFKDQDEDGRAVFAPSGCNPLEAASLLKMAEVENHLSQLEMERQLLLLTHMIHTGSAPLMDYVNAYWKCRHTIAPDTDLTGADKAALKEAKTQYVCRLLKNEENDPLHTTFTQWSDVYNTQAIHHVDNIIQFDGAAAYLSDLGNPALFFEALSHYTARMDLNATPQELGTLLMKSLSEQVMSPAAHQKWHEMESHLTERRQGMGVPLTSLLRQTPQK